MDYRVFIIPVLLTLSALLMYWLFKENPDFEAMADYKHEFVARINGVLFSSYMLLMWFFVETAKDSTTMLEQVLAYMAYDAGHLTLYAKSPDFYIHHAILWLGYMSSDHSDYHMKMAFDATCILESTNPIFSLTWMMDALKYPHDNVHMGILAVMFGIWTLVRMIYYPYWIYKNAAKSTLLTVFNGGYMMLNIYWFYLLCKKGQRILTSVSFSSRRD
jgi:hypothetical protein